MTNKKKENNSKSTIQISQAFFPNANYTMQRNLNMLVPVSAFTQSKRFCIFLRHNRYQVVTVDLGAQNSHCQRQPKWMVVRIEWFRECGEINLVYDVSPGANFMSNSTISTRQKLLLRFAFAFCECVDQNKTKIKEENRQLFSIQVFAEQ